MTGGHLLADSQSSVPAVVSAASVRRDAWERERMSNEISTTRRGFLRGSIGTAGAALVVEAGCSRQLDIEGAAGARTQALRE